MVSQRAAARRASSALNPSRRSGVITSSTAARARAASAALSRAWSAARAAVS